MLSYNTRFLVPEWRKLYLKGGTQARCRMVRHTIVLLCPDFLCMYPIFVSVLLLCPHLLSLFLSSFSVLIYSLCSWLPSLPSSTVFVLCFRWRTLLLSGDRVLWARDITWHATKKDGPELGGETHDGSWCHQGSVLVRLILSFLWSCSPIGVIQSADELADLAGIMSAFSTSYTVFSISSLHHKVSEATYLSGRNTIHQPKKAILHGSLSSRKYLVKGTTLKVSQPYTNSFSLLWSPPITTCPMGGNVNIITARSLAVRKATFLHVFLLLALGCVSLIWE